MSLREQWDLLAQTEPMVIRVHKESKGHKEFKEPQDHKAHKAILDLLGQVPA
jgi:hypothetical protein